MARKKKSQFGCLFWLALALLVVVVFLYNKDTINRVLVESGITDMVREEPEDPPPTPEPAPPPSAPTPPAEVSPVQQHDNTAPDDEIVIRLRPEQEVEKTAESENQPADSSKANTRRARLFFVAVDQEGTIELQGVVRSISYDDSPLTDTMSTLLDGSVSSEITGGLLTMIRRDVRLRNVYVKGGTAYIDFSDEFRFNKLGQVGLSAQVKQVVYTATEFSNVKNVQILIEGERIEYLSSEGPFIGEPLSRERLMDGTA